MEFKGTKGKWEIFKLQGKIIGISTNLGINGNIICEMPTMKNSCKNWDANALLISKAPEMLDMLRKILIHTDWSYEVWAGNHGLIIMEEIEELIKEATEI